MYITVTILIFTLAYSLEETVFGGHQQEIHGACIQVIVSLSSRRMFRHEDAPLHNIIPVSDGPCMIPLCALYDA